MKNIFDTHCHPNLSKDKNQDEIINNFFENWWKYMNVIWTNLKTNKQVLDIAKKYEWIFCSIGIHPCDIYDLDLNKSILELKNNLLNNKDKIIAIGECGLDYYWIEKDEKTNKLDEVDRIKVINEKKKLQKVFFKAQIKLAKEYNLPVIIHNRDSKDDILEVLKELDFKNFIFHCYSENLEYANKLIEFAPECKISFSGIVTFKNAKEIQETAKNIPIKHILAETDSPYLTPTPFRWREENEPLYTKYVIEKINELRWEDCSDKIFENSLNIFWI